MLLLLLLLLLLVETVPHWKEIPVAFQVHIPDIGFLQKGGRRRGGEGGREGGTEGGRERERKGGKEEGGREERVDRGRERERGREGGMERERAKEFETKLKLDSDIVSMSLTACPWEHEATGLTAQTYMHVLSYGGPKKMAAIPELFVFLWEKTGELSDGYFIKALV